MLDPILLTSEQLKSLNSPLLTHNSGELSSCASSMLPPEICQKNSLTFVSSSAQLSLALEKNASIIVATTNLKEQISKQSHSASIFLTPNLSAAFSVIFPILDKKRSRFSEGVHSTAIIDSSARLGKNVRIGPYSVVGKNAQLGNDVIVGSHVVVEADAKISDHCLLHSYCFIGADSELGTGCEIHPYATIGSDGFGYYKNKDEPPVKIPQLGKVVLEENVDVGAHTAIDRATFYETRIKKGAKLDNHCHIAHNCIIGENTMLAAGFMMAGSSSVGANCMAGGMVGVADHIKIADKVALGGRTTVIQDISEPGAYIGYPAMPLKEGLRNLSALTELNVLKKLLYKIKDQVGL